MIRVRGIRGATTADSNTRGAILEATKELLERLVEANNLDVDDMAAVFFTTTDDLDAHYPARVARKVLGWEYVPLSDVQQMKLENEVAYCIRVLILVNTDKSPQDINHVYLNGAANLRN